MIGDNRPTLCRSVITYHHSLQGLHGSSTPNGSNSLQIVIEHLVSGLHAHSYFEPGKNLQCENERIKAVANTLLLTFLSYVKQKREPSEEDPFCSLHRLYYKYQINFNDTYCFNNNYVTFLVMRRKTEGWWAYISYGTIAL